MPASPVTISLTITSWGPSCFPFYLVCSGKRGSSLCRVWTGNARNGDGSRAKSSSEESGASANLPDKTVVVSRALHERYLSRYSKQTSCIPNGTEIREPRGGEHLSTFGLKPDEYVLFLGRFSHEKNCHMLIDAFAKTDTPLKLVLAGGSSYTDDYATSVRERSDKRIKVLDWLSGGALEEVLTNAALFVLPSDLEGSSLALLDAMGAGVCVLASDTPENCEVIADAGFSFKRGDVEDLQRMLSLLLSDERLRRAAGASAQQRVRQSYLWGKVVSEIEALYTELVPERPALSEA